MVAFADVRQWDPDALDGVYRQLQAALQRLVTGGEDFLRVDNRLRFWEGITAVRALAEHQRLEEKLTHHAAGLRLLMKTVTEAGDAIRAVQRAITEAEEYARRYSFRVGENGAITDTITHPGPHDPKPEDRANALNEVRTMLHQIVRTATDIDNDITDVFNRVSAGEVGTGNETTMAAATTHGAQAQSLTLPEPPRNATAAQNAAWWATMSPNAQGIMLGNRPELLGNRDGIPFAVRDKANRARMPEERARLQQQLRDLNRKLAELRDPRSRAYVDAQIRADIDRVNAKLTALDGLLRMLYEPNGNPLPDRQLALLDMSGERAKAAVATGDVDNADHVAVFTPGMNSTVEGNMGEYVGEMGNVRDRAVDQLNRHGPGGTVAAMTYLGYEPPKVSVEDMPGGLVAGLPAHDGADRLTSLYEGINANRQDDPHLSALGHSYGSLTTGLALQNEGTGVDEAVFYGSPGIEDPVTLDTAAPKVPEGHAYVLKAQGDLVGDLTGGVRFGMDPSMNPDLTQLSTEEAVDADKQPLIASHGHGEYMLTRGEGANAVDSTSLYNIANVVAGMPSTNLVQR